MNPAIDSVIEDFRTLLKADGGTLDVVSEDNGVVTLRYVPGHNEECAECVLAPEQICQLVKAALQARIPSIQDVLLM